MVNSDDLEQWRQSIRAIDAEILRLVSDRMRLAERIGNHKKQAQLPVKDYRVEKQIVERARESAAALGVYPSLAEDLMTILIKYSVLKQDELKREGIAPLIDSAKSVLIIGGNGNMGQWFAQYYESLGYSVSIFDNKPQARSQLYPFHPSLDKGLEGFSFIILTTPMLETNLVLHRLAQLRPEALIVEICSLKAPVQTGLEAVIKAGLKVASIHPMFGPDTELLAGKNIVFCEGPGLCSEELKQQHYAQTSAKLIVIPISEHDRLMSYILGASHLINMIYSQILGTSGESLARLKDLAGTTFSRQLEVTGRVVVENQDLYFDIQTLNQSTPQLFESLKKLIAELESMIKDNDRETFRRFMGKAQTFFSENGPM